MGKELRTGILIFGNLLICFGVAAAIVYVIGKAFSLGRVVGLSLPILLGVGILNLKNWARWGLVFYSIGLMVVGLLTGYDSISKMVTALIFRFVLGIGCLIYFNLPAVRADFTKRREG